jgi:hypothetical protein
MRQSDFVILEEPETIWPTVAQLPDHPFQTLTTWPERSRSRKYAGYAAHNDSASGAQQQTNMNSSRIL